MPPSTPSPPPPPPLNSGHRYHLPPPPPYTAKPSRQPYSPPFPSTTPPPRKTHSLLHPRHKTNPLIWLCAVLCVLFSLLIILAGVLTLFIFLVVRPHSPAFDISSVTLNNLYLDSSPTSSIYLNSDVSIVTNFSNPNHKLDITFEYLSLDLYFNERLLTEQAIQPFSQRRGETSLVALRMVASEVYLVPAMANEIYRQAKSNKIEYNARATLKVRATLGVAHYTYWLYGRCEVEVTAPPAGVLVAKTCTTKR